jgi:hypothetical protein
MSLTHRLLFATLLALPAPLLAADPSADKLIFTGAATPGVTQVSLSGNVYSFVFQGDEVLTYTLDLNLTKNLGGMLRIRELTSASFPMDGCGFVYRDPAGVYWYPQSLFPKTTLQSHSLSGNTVTLDYVLNFNGLHPVRYEISLEQKALRVRIHDPTGNKAFSNNFSGIIYGNSTGVETPRRVAMQGTHAQPITLFRKSVSGGNLHFFVANALDLFQSNASDYSTQYLTAPNLGVDWVTTALNTAEQYKVLSNGQLAEGLDDTYTVVVSSKIRDVLLTSTAPPSPYFGLLSNRLFVNAPEKTWSWYSGMFDKFVYLGLDNVAAYFFDWSAGGIDPPGVDNYGPDWFPAVDPPEFQATMFKGRIYGNLVGAYTAFNCVPHTAPPAVVDPADYVRDAAGNVKLYSQLGFPLLGVEAAVPHMEAELGQLKAYGANMAYLDIQTYGSLSKAPDGDHLDQQAHSPWAKTHRQGFAAQKTWFEGMRTILEGPLLGEGSIGTVKSNMEFLWNGYVDSIQRVINTASGTNASNLPAGSPLAPTNWPIIPEYEWRVAARTQVNHGNGFYDRFFGPSDGPTVVDMATGLPHMPLTQDALDLYQAFLITYGHAGYAASNGTQSGTQGYLTNAGMAQTYFLTNALQTRYFSSPVLTIRYRWNGGWKTFEQVLFETETTESFRHIPIAVLFGSGLRIYVNHGLTPLNINEGGLTYTLPAKTGWWAGDGGLLVSFSAIPPGTDGNRIDYCRALGQYEYFNGRGAVEGYGNLHTPWRLAKWHVFNTNTTFQEDEFGNFWPDFLTPPGLLQMYMYPGNATFYPGQRLGMRAIAIFDNASVRDVTTMMMWFSSKPWVAKVNFAGVLEAVSPGTTKIFALTPMGTVIAAPMTMTVLP